MKKTVLFLLIAMAVSFGAFANGAGESTTNEAVSFSVEAVDYEPVRSIDVDPTSEILAVFENYGIDADSIIDSVYEDEDGDEYTVTAATTQAVNNELAMIFQENRDGIVDMITGELESHLHRDGTEEATMTIGGFEFTASLDYPAV